MVQSTAATVDDFMTEVGPDRLPYIQQLRAACLANLGGWEERMAWGMPGYGPAGADPVVSFNNQKQHIALYVGRTAVDSFREALAVPGVSLGGGCIRYKNPKKLDLAVVEDILRGIRSRGPGGGCA